MGSSFEELLRAAQEGRTDAVEELYASYGALIMQYVRRDLRPGLRRRFDSLDLMHSVFLDVLRDLPRFEIRGENAFERWLYLKAQNKVRDKLRHYLDRQGQAREAVPAAALAGLDTGKGPVQSAVSREQGVRLEEVLERLDEDSRRLLQLRLQEGLPFGEIAGRLDLASSEAARKRYTRAMERLRREWKAP